MPLLRSIACLLLLTAAACGAERLTGPAAQQAVAEGQARFSVLPDSIAVFIDGVRQPAGSRLDIAPGTVQRVEVIRGEAARARFGDDARGGAIYIYTKAPDR